MRGRGLWRKGLWNALDVQVRGRPHKSRKIMFHFSQLKCRYFGFSAFFLLFMLFLAAFLKPPSHLYARVGEKSFLVNLLCTLLPFVYAKRLTTTSHAYPAASARRKKMQTSSLSYTTSPSTDGENKAVAPQGKALWSDGLLSCQ